MLINLSIEVMNICLIYLFRDFFPVYFTGILHINYFCQILMHCIFSFISFMWEHFIILNQHPNWTKSRISSTNTTSTYQYCMERNQNFLLFMCIRIWKIKWFDIVLYPWHRVFHENVISDWHWIYFMAPNMS